MILSYPTTSSVSFNLEVYDVAKLLAFSIYLKLLIIIIILVEVGHHIFALCYIYIYIYILGRNGRSYLVNIEFIQQHHNPIIGHTIYYS